MRSLILIDNETRHVRSHIDMHMHAGSIVYNPMTLTCDLLTSASMHAKIRLSSICLPNLMLIAQVVFLFEVGHTHILTDRHSHRRYC